MVNKTSDLHLKMIEKYIYLPSSINIMSHKSQLHVQENHVHYKQTVQTTVLIMNPTGKKNCGAAHYHKISSI